MRVPCKPSARCHVCGRSLTSLPDADVRSHFPVVWFGFVGVGVGVEHGVGYGVATNTHTADGDSTRANVPNRAIASGAIPWFSQKHTTDSPSTTPSLRLSDNLAVEAHSAAASPSNADRKTTQPPTRASPQHLQYKPHQRLAAQKCLLRRRFTRSPRTQ